MANQDVCIYVARLRRQTAGESLAAMCHLNARPQDTQASCKSKAEEYKAPPYYDSVSFNVVLVAHLLVMYMSLWLSVFDDRSNALTSGSQAKLACIGQLVSPRFPHFPFPTSFITHVTHL